MTRLIDDRMSKLQQQKNDETHDMSFREKILQSTAMSYEIA